MSEEILNKLLHKVEKMECKLASAASLNGGFDKLLVEVVHIKETQNEVLQGMRGIKKSIYEPDSGLFSRVKQLEIESERRMEFVNEAKPSLEFARELGVWKVQADKDLEEVEHLKMEVAELRSWKEGITKVIWLIATAAAAMWIKHFMDLLMK